MSVKRVEVASVQFQIESRQANASMRALEEEAKELNGKITEVQKNIEGLGNVPKDNPQLLAFQNQAKQLKRDLDDVNKTIKDYTRGVKAADELLRNYDRGTIETMSMKAIKAGQNGLKKRIENIDPNKADAEELKAYRIISEVIDEADRVVNDFKVDAEKTIEILQNGGTVAEATLKKTLDGLKTLRDSVVKGSDEWNQYNEQLVKIQESVAKIRKEEQASAAKILGDQNLGKYNEEQIKKAIDAARELIKTYETGSTEAQQIAQYIVRAEEHLKNYGVEAERAARKQVAAEEEARRKIQEKLDMMTGRMSDVSKLTDSALQETKRYWEEQVAGAERGSKEAQQYEAYIKQISNEQERIANERRAKTAEGIFGDLGAMSEQEIRAAIDAARQLQQTLSVTSDEYKQISIAIVNAEEHVKKYGIEAERAARKEAAAQEEAERKLQEKTDMMLQRMQNLGSLTKEGLDETKKFWEAQMTGAQRGSDEAQRYATYIKTITAEQEYLARVQAREGAMKLQNPNVTMSEGEMRKAIDDAKKYLQTLSLTDDEYKTVAGSIAAAEEYIKRFGLEAERSTMLAELKMKEMNDRMADLPKLSDAALQETKKFWEEQLSGAERGSKEAQQYEEHIKNINKLQEQIAAERTQKTAQGIYGNLQTMGEKEIRAAIEAARQYQQTLSLNTREYQELSNAIVNAEEYIKNYGIEAERAARKEAEAQNEAYRKLEEKMNMMTERMGDVTRLTDATLAETKKYWEQQLVGVERNSDAAKTYEGHIRTIIEEQERLAAIQNRQSAQKLFGDLNTMSEQNIRGAIDAARKYQQTLSVTDDEYQNLSRAIVNAEEHIKKYGIEAERAARKEVEAAEKAARKRMEADAMMQNQLLTSKNLTESALKAQEQYWKKLIDDPKTAASSLDQYKQNLAEVKRMQEEMVREQGREALNFFTSGQNADATGDEIDKRAKALKAYRGQLHQLTDASDIAEIDRILESLRKNADAAKGELMSLAEAMEIVDKVDFDPDGKLNFEGTTEQLIGAKNALEKELAVVQRGSARYQELRDKVDKLNAAIEGTRINQAQVDAILANPKTASYDQLKMAIDAARKRLNSMRRDTEEQRKAFDELAKSIKQADIEMKALGSSSRGTASAFDKAWSRLKTYVGLYVGAAVAMQKVTATMGDLMELSDRMGEVRKTTGFTADEVGRLTTELKKLDTRTTLTSLMELSSIAGSIGLKTQQQVQGFAEAANMLTVALPEMGNEASRTFIKIADATGDLEKNGGRVKETLEKVGSTIIALRANSAAAAGPITDFVSRVGAVGAQAGISIDQIAALGATVDALGGRVEMSATALSRMIPAIKNNSFAVAQAIGMTEKELKGMDGMQQMVAIFRRLHDSVKDFDMTTEEGMNAAADAVENMMGKSTSMQEVMKTLNQQGARAGIVFGLLSQNVDMLEKQLGIAGEAYQKNTALMDEYNKMNDTTAAKWERLKNQLEEFFVGDQAQRWLGGIIDGLRGIVDLLTGNGGLSNAIRSIIVAWGVLKLGIGEAFWKYIILNIAAVGKGLFSLSTTMTAVKNKWVASWKAMDAATKANWIFAIIAAVYMLGKAIYDAATKVSELDKALNELENEESNNEHILNRLVTSYKNVSARVAETTKKHDELEKKTKKLGEEVDRLKKSTDLSSEATETLKKKEEELKKTKEELKKATDENNKANGERLDLIKQINDKYSTYLGYMLSEKTAAEQVASAHQLIISALKEELAQKRLLRSQEAIENKYDEDIQEWRQNSREELESGALTGHKDLQQQVMEKWESVMARISYDTKTGMFTVPVIDGINATALTAKTVEELRPALQTLLSNTMTKVAKEANVDRGFYFGQAGSEFDRAKMAWGGNYGSASPDDGFGRWTEATLLREQEIQQQRALDIASLNGAHQQTVQDAIADINTNATFISNTLQENQELTNDKIGELARTTNAIVKSIKKYEGDIEDVSQYVGEGNDVTLENAVNTMFASIDANTRKTILAAAKRAANAGTSGTTPTVPTNPYGDFNRVTSPYSDWSGNDLVARRKEMLERVKALANGADVQAVLSEDAKFISEAVRKNIKTTEQAIEWYNAERLKIQTALKEKHLTPTGDWDNSKEGSKKRNRLDESNYALAELDRYYSRRKEALEKARAEENMTEELYNREAELLEQEHLKKRSDLRRTFTADNSKEEQAMVKQFREWWKTLAKTGELDEVPWAKVESEWAKATEDQLGQNNLRAQEDLTKLQGIVVKHLNQIAKIIDGERPYDGITANLRKNLTDMDILFADFQKNGPTEDIATMVQEGNKRLQFLLGEAETAYSSTIEDVLRHMGERGMTAWADEIRKSPDMQNALMAQLQQAYDKVQDAIKKEAAQIKKQTDIWWSDTEKGQTQSRKGGFESMLSRLGLQEDQVKRANSLIGAGQASQRVADKLAIKQMQVQLQMQQTYYHRMRQIGEERIRQLEAQGKLEDAEHLRRSLNLSLTKEQSELDKQRVAIANQLEESQNRLYTELREWGDLLASSLKDIFEASAAGNEDYYNELAKLNLTGKGGPGAGTYVVIDNAGTSDAKAHYEYLDERQALERQHEIEQENAKAEAWKKVMDDISQKMNDTITDWMNAMVQNASIDANTDATLKNTEAIVGLSAAMSGSKAGGTLDNIGLGKTGEAGDTGTGLGVNAALTQEEAQEFVQGMGDNPMMFWSNQSDIATQNMLNNMGKLKKGQEDTNKAMQAGAQSTFAKMTAAANMYGIAYQAMSNDNLSTTQKFEMMAVQAAGQSAISMLTVDFSTMTGEAAINSASVLGKLWSQLGYWAIPVYALFTGLLGGLMGVAVSKIAKSKSEIAQVSGASVSAGKLATGMMTYAEGNVNEFTDPASLTPGRQYNVDAADGRTYRARYMGSNPQTHLTNGPEFHLAGEKGREMIIDAGTTRQITMNEGEIWHTIQTLSNGGHGYARRRSTGRGGMRAFAEGNVEEFEDMTVGDNIATNGTIGMTPDQMLAFQASLDRNSAIMERLAEEGIEAFVSPYGKRGIVNGYDTYKKEAVRHGERYS